MVEGLKVGLADVVIGAPAQQYVSDARRAADMGFDVFELPDHLGLVAPLATLAGVAAAVPQISVSNCVLNAAFYNPHLLVRDMAAVHQLSGGRFIATLGAGWNQEEFSAAGIPFPSPAERIHKLRDMAVAIRDIYNDPTFVAPSDYPAPPIRLAGNGDRLLAMAAQYADIVMIDPGVTEPELAERIEYVRTQAGDRAEDISFAFSLIVAFDPADLEFLRHAKPGGSDDEIRALASALTGSIDDAASRIHRIREMGVDYVTLGRSSSIRWETLEQLMDAL